MEHVLGVLLRCSALASPKTQDPEQWLHAALLATTPELRAKYASSGLSAGELEADTHALLLRQLFIAHMECGSFGSARDIALQVLSTDELVEPAHHDAAKAYLVLGEYASAARHFSSAADVAPDFRKSLHLSCHAALLYLMRDFEQSHAVITQCLEWSNGKEVLYRAQMALAEAALGTHQHLESALSELLSVPELGVFGTFVLAELHYYTRETDQALAGYSRFLARVRSLDSLQRAGLSAEQLHSERRLQQDRSPH